MTHVRIPDFSEPVPVRNPAERRAARAVALDLPPQALEPSRPAAFVRAAGCLGELLVAVVIIAGGIFLTGFASLH